MATKKSTPKKTSAKANASSIARNANKGFTAGLTSTLGPDPKPYNRRQDAIQAARNKMSDAKASTGSVKAKSLGNAKTHGNTQRKADHQEQMASRKTSTGKSGITGMKRMIHAPSEETLKATNTAASTARGQRLNSSTSMPKGVSGRIDRRSDGSLVTEPPKSGSGREDARITTTAAARSRGVNTRRYYPVDRIVGGTNGGFAIPEDKYKVPEGASNVRYDSFKDKYVPVFTSGSKKKSTKKDLPRDYGL